MRYGTVLTTVSMGIAKLTPDDIPVPEMHQWEKKTLLKVNNPVVQIILI